MKKNIAKLKLSDSTKHKVIKISKLMTFITLIFLVVYAFIACNDNFHSYFSGITVFKSFSYIMLAMLIIDCIFLMLLAVFEAVELKFENQSGLSKFITNFVGLFFLIFIVDNYFLKDDDSVLAIILFAAVISSANIGIDYWKRDPVRIAKIEKMEKENN